MNKANVLVAMPTDYYYDYVFVTSYSRALALHESEGQFTLRHSAYKNIVGARNDACKEAIDGGYTHIMFIDSDMKLPEMALSKLLAHDLDIVGGLYCQKAGGMFPNVFKIEGEWERDGSMRTHYPTQPLEECDAIGTGCLLIKTDVLRAIPPLWFNYEPYPEANLKHKIQSEDVVFCRIARSHGFRIHVDSTIKCGHVGHFVVFPNDGEKVRVEPL